MNMKNNQQSQKLICLDADNTIFEDHVHSMLSSNGYNDALALENFDALKNSFPIKNKQYFKLEYQQRLNPNFREKYSKILGLITREITTGKGNNNIISLSFPI